MSLQLLLKTIDRVKHIRKILSAVWNFQKGKYELLPIPEDELQINYKLNNRNNPGY